MVNCYTKEDYAKAYTELLEILKYFSKESLEKLPKENIEMYNLEKDKNYNFTYNEELELDEQNISKLTIILIANLYIQYLASDEERNIIKERDKKELELLEEQKRQMYNPDEIFENRKQENSKYNIEDISKTKQNQNISLLIVKNQNIFAKIIEKIKLKFKIGKE